MLSKLPIVPASVVVVLFWFSWQLRGIRKSQETSNMDVATLKGNIDKLGTDLRAKFDTIQTEITTYKNKGGATADELDALGQSVASLDAAVVAFDPDAPVAAPGPAPDPAAGASA